METNTDNDQDSIQEEEIFIFTPKVVTIDRSIQVRGMTVLANVSCGDWQIFWI